VAFASATRSRDGCRQFLPRAESRTAGPFVGKPGRGRAASFTARRSNRAVALGTGVGPRHRRGLVSHGTAVLGHLGAAVSEPGPAGPLHLPPRRGKARMGALAASASVVTTEPPPPPRRPSPPREPAPPRATHDSSTLHRIGHDFATVGVLIGDGALQAVRDRQRITWSTWRRKRVARPSKPLNACKLLLGRGRRRASIKHGQAVLRGE
jgi:hypothetical protein